MHKAVFILCACATLFSSLEGNGVKDRVDTMSSLKAVAASNHNFTMALYQKLSRGDGNVFFSPLSIHMILALASIGAHGTTEQQMITGLSLPQDKELIKDGFQKLAQTLKRNDNVIVKIANKILTDSHFDLKEDFIAMAQSYFHADASKADFKNDAEGARQKINRWVEDKTNDKIKDLFAAGSLSENTEMVLANAVYFKSNWASEFNKEETTNEPFHVTATETVDVPTMYIKEEFFYKKCKDLDAQILEIPYIDHKLSLLIILPTKIDGLAEVERRLSTMSFNTVTKHLRFMDVQVWLPSFKMEQTIDLKPVLTEMGMTDMFSQSANFSGMTESGVFVGKAVHKAFIEVNEEGSEAAGASGLGITLLSLPMAPVPPVIFKADHPFIFFLRHKLSQRTFGGPSTILFMGRHTTPTAATLETTS